MWSREASSHMTPGTESKADTVHGNLGERFRDGPYGVGSGDPLPLICFGSLVPWRDAEAMACVTSQVTRAIISSMAFRRFLTKPR